MKLVARKRMATMPSNMAAVPVIWPVKYNITISTAKSVRITLSIIPIFCFMNISPFVIPGMIFIVPGMRNIHADCCGIKVSCVEKDSYVIRL